MVKDRFLRWLNAPRERIREAAPAEPLEFFLTGPSLIGRIVRAIELGQSVVLSGPRGCGKSHCIWAAMTEAERRGVIPRDAYVFLQGNREIPRDYLAEDDIAFRTRVLHTAEPTAARTGGERDAGKDKLRAEANGDMGEFIEVLPDKRYAPLFQFAARDPVWKEPVVTGGVVRCELRTRGPDGKDTVVPCEKFVLFLDEINRFSDGVLDSLLSVLEERKAVLAGKTYKLPVVVCMTMNPPGYDATARKLSPPLAARIGRGYRLWTPDLDTLGDRIVEDRMDQLRGAHEKRRAEAIAAGHDPEPEFPDLLSLDAAGRRAGGMSLVKAGRKAALVTLCLWGDVTKIKPQPKAGLEYLTEGTKHLLKRVMSDRDVTEAMRVVHRLCHFGPDGRAAADWMTSAVGLALEEAARARLPKAVLREKHLTATVVESVAHKIYDNFSPASQPHETVNKENAVRTICRRVFKRPLFDELTLRQVDNPASLWDPFKSLFDFSGEKLADMQFRLRRAFTHSGVTDDADVARWRDVAKEFAAKAPSGPDAASDLLKLLEQSRGGVRIVIPAAGELKAGFSRDSYDQLARVLAQAPVSVLARRTGENTFRGTFPQALAKILERIGPVRQAFEEELADFEFHRLIGGDVFRAAYHSAGFESEHRAEILLLAELAEDIWDPFPLQADKKGHAQQAVKDVLNGLDSRFHKSVAKALVALLEPFRRADERYRGGDTEGYAKFLEQVRISFHQVLKDESPHKKGSG